MFGREVNDTTQVRDNKDGSYMASFVPQQVGEVKLLVFFYGEQIKGSPYSVMVRISHSKQAQQSSKQ